MMKLFVLLVLVAGTFASDDECPSNQHYNDCGTLCPVTCENYKNPPKACFLMCNPGCECDDGYVKDKDGSCVEPEDCSVPEEKNCFDKPDGGMCRGNFPMWYYDEDAMDCKEFVYGGCQGNGNRYGSRTECLKSCASIWESNSDRCDLPAKTGACRGYFRRFYFDKVAGQCKKFIYGGCGGNENNFKTEEECESECGNRATALDGYDCDMAPDSGVCYASFRRYYYDQKDGQCKKFTYGGCHGNKNNFRTEEECYKKCGAGVCGENERYSECGTACPLTCENYDNPPKICPAMCKIGCECETGFVRQADGKCVRPAQCPNRQAAPDSYDCDQPPKDGVCYALFHRYYYDQKDGQCKKFVYGGCGGNKNNFRTEEECYKKCGASHAKSRNACEEDKVVGSCKAAFARFYFNKNTGHCEPFIYGGCDGNSNNFLTLEDCEDVCIY